MQNIPLPLDITGVTGTQGGAHVARPDAEPKSPKIDITFADLFNAEGESDDMTDHSDPVMTDEAEAEGSDQDLKAEAPDLDLKELLTGTDDSAATSQQPDEDDAGHQTVVADPRAFKSPASVEFPLHYVVSSQGHAGHAPDGDVTDPSPPQTPNESAWRDHLFDRGSNQPPAHNVTALQSALPLGAAELPAGMVLTPVTSATPTHIVSPENILANDPGNPLLASSDPEQRTNLPVVEKPTLPLDGLLPDSASSDPAHAGPRADPSGFGGVSGPLMGSENSVPGTRSAPLNAADLLMAQRLQVQTDARGGDTRPSTSDGSRPFLTPTTNIPGSVIAPGLSATQQAEAAPGAPLATPAERSLPLRSERGREVGRNGTDPVAPSATLQAAGSTPPLIHNTAVSAQAMQALTPETLTDRMPFDFQTLGELRFSTDTSAPRITSETVFTRPEIPRHMAMQIADAIQRGGQARPVELSLNPVELGRVKISLQMGESTVLVHVMADRPETLDLMRRHAELLAQEFHNIGYGDASFTFAQQGDGGTATHAEEDGTPRDDTTLSEVTTPENAPTANLPGIITDRVDIRV